jgi:hypothetical protein
MGWWTSCPAAQILLGASTIGSCEIAKLEGGVEEKRGAQAGLWALWAVPD